MAFSGGHGRVGAIRRVARNGKSLTIGLPRSFRESLKLRRGDFVFMSLVRGDGYFTVRRADAYVSTPADPERRRSTLIAYRKVLKYGNGQMIGVPPPFLSELHIFLRDELLLVMNPDRTSFSVRPWQERAVGPAEPATTMGVAEVES